MYLDNPPNIPYGTHWPTHNDWQLDEFERFFGSETPHSLLAMHFVFQKHKIPPDILQKMPPKWVLPCFDLIDRYPYHKTAHSLLGI